MSFHSSESLQEAARAEWARIQALPQPLKPRDRLAIPMQEMPTQEPLVRARNMQEVALGYFEEEAEASDTVEALGDYLFENHGEKVPFLFRPVSGGRGWSGVVTLQAGGTGGEQGNFSEQSVELPLDGQPTRVAAVTAP